MIKIDNYLRTIFHLINLLLVIFYLYPGSIFGYLLYGDINQQPHITSDYLNISSNHFYAFISLSILGSISYRNDKKINFVFKYLFCLSFILELFHIIIPQRSFQLSDLLGNFLGVLIIFIFFYTIKKI